MLSPNVLGSRYQDFRAFPDGSRRLSRARQHSHEDQDPPRPPLQLEAGATNCKFRAAQAAVGAVCQRRADCSGTATGCAGAAPVAGGRAGGARRRSRDRGADPCAGGPEAGAAAAVLERHAGGAKRGVRCWRR